MPHDARAICASSTCVQRSGQMIPLDNLVTIEQSSGPQVINHYNLFRSAEIDGFACAGRQLRRGADGHGAAVEEDHDPGHELTSGPASRSKRSNPPARPSSSSGSACSSSISRSRPSTRASRCRSSSCWPCRWRSSARSASSRCAVWRMTSTARSASSCSSVSQRRTPFSSSSSPSSCAATGKLDHRRRDRSSRAPPAADPDDLVSPSSSACLPPGLRHRRRRARPSLGRNHDRRRHVGLHHPQPDLHPGPLRHSCSRCWSACAQAAHSTRGRCRTALSQHAQQHLSRSVSRAPAQSGRMGMLASLLVAVRDHVVFDAVVDWRRSRRRESADRASHA